jgi:transcriptional regulator with XRE-family HTH domain
MLVQPSLSIADTRRCDAVLDSQIVARLGEAVSSRRQELGLSCLAVATSIGVTEQKLAAFESGQIDASSVRLEFILQLAKALDVAARDIFVALDNL